MTDQPLRGDPPARPTVRPVADIADETALVVCCVLDGLQAVRDALREAVAGIAARADHALPGWQVQEVTP